MKNYLILSMTFISFSLQAASSAGITPNWSSAKKKQVGTSYNKQSLVWFTSADGILTESYYPTIDAAQLKDSQILVSDEKGFFADEKYGTSHQVIINHPSLTTHTNSHSKFHISHTYYAHSDKNVIIDEVEVVALEDGLSFYLLTNPALNNTGYYDNGYSSEKGFDFWENETNLYVKVSAGLSAHNIGYVGINDGHLDLRSDYVLNETTNYLENGNIAGTGKIDIPNKAGSYKFYITYAFENNETFSEAELAAQKNSYTTGWDNYLGSIDRPYFKNTAEKNLYERSLYTLKVHEDKLNPGAMIASLSKPWGEELFEYPGVFTGGYHLVWPRDHYHVSLALLKSGDFETPLAALGFLKRIQYKEGQWNFNHERVIPKRGAFPQNAWTNLKEYWGGLQIDQVGYPIHLYYQVYQKADNETRAYMEKEFGEMIHLASEFIFNYGPWSAQERWEENFGISPSSFSVATSALMLATRISGNEKYEVKAKGWLTKPHDNIHTWTFTENGQYGDGKYYVRVAGCDSYLANWNPNNGAWCTVANSGQRVPMVAMLDQGFMKLALLGLVPAGDSRIETSLNKVNQNIRHTFKSGYHGWYRYSYDAYGEEKRGRLWPLLSGEHGRYAIEKYRAGKSTWDVAKDKVNHILDSYQFFANEGLMIPEQVFENSGEGTGAATPLAWSHAEFVKLMWSRNERKNVENPF